ncbi:MAG: hypothetical protein KKE73_09580 [Proteobacteria bacterium]|nr:hypothetical protein [Pseudomonadota bacterium]
MKTDAMTALRDAASNLGRGGKELTNALLYAALGVPTQDTAERDRIRKRCTMLVRSGELVRIAPGRYTYNFKATPAQTHIIAAQMWRAIRSAGPGFTVQEITRLSGANYNYATKYIRHLEGEGYILRHGRDGNVLKYRMSSKGRQARNAPLPSKPITDPFEDERRAVHELVGLFLLRDPYQPAVRERIVTASRTILERFEKEEDAS